MAGMTTDAEDAAFLAERRRADERRYLIAVLDPEKAPRLAPATNAIRDLLADGEWHGHRRLLAAAIRAEPSLAVGTMNNYLRRLASAGLVERRGRYLPNGPHGAVDWREYQLIDWPRS